MRRPVEPGQYTSIAYTERLYELGADASIGTVGDSYDNALTETVNGLYKAKLVRNPVVLTASGGHWKGIHDLEIATCGWVSWFNEQRLHEALSDLTPADYENRPTTIQCSQVFPELHGTLVFGPSGQFDANCLEHFKGGPQAVETTVFDCSERLPDFDPEAVIGIQVRTKSGNLLTNCVVHF